MRLLILAGLVYFIFRSLKSWMRSSTRSSAPMTGGTAGEIDDIMVKDPLCEVYFPKRNGVRFMFEGEELLFCSTECRNKFVDLHASNKP